MTFTVTSLSAIERAFKDADQLGAVIPKNVRAGHAELVGIVARTRDFTATLRRDLGTAVVAAVEAEVDPLADPAVQEAAMAAHVNAGYGAVNGALHARMGAFVNAAAPAVLDALRKPFDAAAADIAAAVAVLGDISLDDTSSVARKGPAAGKAWVEAENGEQTITAVVRVWRNLASAGATSVGPWSDRYGLLAWCDVPAEAFVNEGLAGAKVRPWDAARRGWSLDLATPEGWRQRIAGIGDEEARRREQRKAEADKARAAVGLA